MTKAGAGCSTSLPRGLAKSCFACALLSIAILCSAAVLAGPAAAHTRSQSFSSWRVREGNVRVVFSVSAFEATRLLALDERAGSLDETLLAHLAEKLSVRSSGARCPTRGAAHSLLARDGYLRAELAFECDTAAMMEIGNEAFFVVAPAHVHYARITVDDSPTLEYLFTDVDRMRSVAGVGAGASGPASFSAYLALGVEHIFGGLDHIAFLLALLLLCRRPREVLFMVTGFTLGHSLTLSLAVLGIVRPHATAVEALIGFTIALVGAENIGVRSGGGSSIALVGAACLVLLAAAGLATESGLPVSILLGLALFTLCYLPLSLSAESVARSRPALTAMFGLIHGFGFSRVLTQAGLPEDRLLPALFGFNLGVELGQLVIVAACAALAYVVLRGLSSERRGLAFDFASALLCGLGVFWFIDRALGAY